jgi:GNS1/SUR4 family
MAAVDYFIDATRYVETHFLVPYLTPLETYLAGLAKEHLPQAYEFCDNFLNTQQSMLSKRLPLMNPFHALAIAVAYLVLVFTGKWVMQNLVKSKFQLKTFSNIHNAFCVWLSFYMATNISYQALVVRRYYLVGNGRDDTEEAYPVSLLQLLTH